jgi:hypothetical protein
MIVSSFRTSSFSFRSTNANLAHIPLLKELKEILEPGSYKYSAPTGPAKAFRTSGGKAATVYDPEALIHPRLPTTKQAHADEGSAVAPSHHDLRFTLLLTNRSDSIGAPSPRAPTGRGSAIKM